MKTAESKERGFIGEKHHSAQMILTGDEFLSAQDLVPVQRQAAERSLNRALAELEEMINERKWEDLIETFHPVHAKYPELVENGMDMEIRAKVAFAMGQVNRFDDAIKELEACIRSRPDNFLYHNSLAYTAYNSLFASKNREIFLSGKARRDRIELANGTFKKANELRPDGVTNHYREGMLFKQLENKLEQAVPLFLRAVKNWEALTEEERKVRHQERKNYVKSLYQLAGCHLQKNMFKRALEDIQGCLSEDEKTGYLSLVNKYYTLGKVRYHLNDFSKAKDALMFALQVNRDQPVDFVYELLGRTYLSMGNPERALEVMEKFPEKKRRPYFRWTEADILCALHRYRDAIRVLEICRERDRRSKHVALIRLAKLQYILGNYSETSRYAEEATRFFEDLWGGLYHDGLFWKALACFRAGDLKEAGELAETLRSERWNYPKLDRLLEELSLRKERGQSK